MGRSESRPPSVTEILKAAGLANEHYTGTAPRDRGTRLHGHLAEWLRTGAIASEIRALAPLVAPLVQGEILRVEDRLFSPLGFSGQIDTLRRRPREGGAELAILDWKFGVADPAHAIQTAGYAVLVGEAEGVSAYMIRRACVYLTPGDPWRVRTVWHEDPHDVADFLGALRVARWRMQHRGWTPPARDL
jgi:hypothetical protein